MCEFVSTQQSEGPAGRLWPDSLFPSFTSQGSMPPGLYVHIVSVALTSWEISHSGSFLLHFVAALCNAVFQIAFLSFHSITPLYPYKEWTRHGLKTHKAIPYLPLAHCNCKAEKCISEEPSLGRHIRSVLGSRCPCRRAGLGVTLH